MTVPSVATWRILIALKSRIFPELSAAKLPDLPVYHGADDSVRIDAADEQGGCMPPDAT